MLLAPRVGVLVETVLLLTEDIGRENGKDMFEGSEIQEKVADDMSV